MKTIMKEKCTMKSKPFRVLSVLGAMIFYSHTSFAIDNNGADNSGYKSYFMQGMGHQGGMNYQKGMQKNSIKKMTKFLDLSKDQQIQIKAIKAQAKESNIALRSKMKAFRSEVKALMRAKEFDEQAFNTLHSENQENSMKVALQKAKIHHSILQVLTEEQRLKWQTFMEMKMSKKRKKISQG